MALKKYKEYLTFGRTKACLKIWMVAFVPSKHQKRLIVLATTEHLPKKTKLACQMSVLGSYYYTSRPSRVSMWLTVGFNLDLPACQRPAWQTDERCLSLWQVVSQTGQCKMPHQGQTCGSFNKTLWSSMWTGREAWREMREHRGVGQGLAVLICCLKTAIIQVGGWRKYKGWVRGDSLRGGWRTNGRKSNYLTDIVKQTHYPCPSLSLFPSFSAPSPLQSPTVTQTPSASPPPPACSPSRTLAPERGATVSPYRLELTCRASSPTSFTQAGWPLRGPQCTHSQGDKTRHQLQLALVFSHVSSGALLLPMPIWQLVSFLLRSSLKYVNVDFHEILCRFLWSPEDESHWLWSSAVQSYYSLLLNICGFK